MVKDETSLCPERERFYDADGDGSILQRTDLI